MSEEHEVPEPAVKPDSPARRKSVDDERWAKWALTAVVAAGILAGLIIYLNNRSFIIDEAMLACNVIFRPLADIRNHLDDNQLAPPLFLILSKLSSALFKPWDLSLRVLPLVCSFLSLYLFARLGWRTMRSWFVVVSTTILSLNFEYLEFSTTFKQYACDLLVTLLLLAVATSWSGMKRRARLLVAVLLPLLIGLSFTTVFGLFGLWVVILMFALRSREGKNWEPVVILGAMTLVVSILLWLMMLSQYHHASFLSEFWRAGFPQGSIVSWTLLAFSSVLGYLVGSPPMAHIWAVISVIGFISLARCARPVAAFSIASISAAILLAILGYYPFAGERVVLYLAPVGLLSLAAGLKAIWTWKRIGAFRFVAVVLSVFLILWSGFSIWLRGNEIWLGDGLMAVIAQLDLGNAVKVPILVSKRASYAFRVYTVDQDRAQAIYLSDWNLSLGQLYAGWVRAGMPRRFWLVQSGRDDRVSGENGAGLARHCVVRQSIRRGNSAATLIEVAAELELTPAQ
ncbi:MAG: hypothetical protein JW941_10235 [Candidatus Coatesbacteria bacterium]|nr:hypothetical protein [Candidatus Coatesbacteria bacterium]